MKRYFARGIFHLQLFHHCGMTGLAICVVSREGFSVQLYVCNRRRELIKNGWCTLKVYDGLTVNGIVLRGMSSIVRNKQNKDAKL